MIQTESNEWIDKVSTYLDVMHVTLIEVID